MPADFLHGVETIVLKNGPRPIKVVKSSVICIVGNAPKGGDPNHPKMIITDDDAAAYGSKLPGFDIPFVIEKIRKAGAGTIIVVNTFKGTPGLTVVTSESHTVTSHKITLTFIPDPSVEVVIKSSDGTTTYVKDTDYSIDAFGNVTIINTTDIADSTVLKSTYSKTSITSTNLAAVSAESQTVTNYKFKLGFAPLADRIVLTNSDTTMAYIKDIDYSVDDFGNVLILKPSVIAENSVVKAYYYKLDSTTIIASQIVGTLTSGVRTGLQVLDLVYPTFGFNPKVIVCSDWNTNTTVSAGMKAKAEYWRAIYLLDAATGFLPSDVVEQRGPAGTANISTVSERAFITYPHLKELDPDPAADASATILRPYSETMAAVIAKTDSEFGYWFSPSNKVIDDAILGGELLLSFLINKADTDVNVLNSFGITTFIKDSNLYTWGNRNASFPSQTGINTFIGNTRVSDIIAESIEYFSRPYIDTPISTALIDVITESVNGFMRSLIGKGAIVDGSCSYNPDNNPAEELANGHIQFDYEFVWGPPAERITYRSFININLLNKLAA